MVRFQSTTGEGKRRGGSPTRKRDILEGLCAKRCTPDSGSTVSVLELTRTMAAAAAGSGFAGDVPIFHAENLVSNIKSINYSRTFLSIISGVVAGIWGFTGLMGFVFYFLVMMVASLGLLLKAKFSVHTYFDSWNRIVIEGVLGGLMSFVLFWTFAYDIVHIF